MHIQIQKSVLLVTATACSISIAGCGSLAPFKDPNVEKQLMETGTVYGIVVGIGSADDPSNVKVCQTNPGSGRSAEICRRLTDYNAATANIAATTNRSFLKVTFFAEKSIELKKDDIVKINIGYPSELVSIASHGERDGCKWIGDRPIMMGFPFQEGGIACEGWSYKQIMHINWEPKTWLGF